MTLVVIDPYACPHSLLQSLSKGRMSLMVGENAADSVHLDHEGYGALKALLHGSSQLIEVLYAPFCRGIGKESDFYVLKKMIPGRTGDRKSTRLNSSHL